MSENYFAQMAKIDVSNYVEKKGKFSYLSWAYAVDQLRKHDPAATWEVIRFNGLPFLKSECGYFVEVAVTCNGITLSQIHPVLDNNNKPIAQPNSFQINTSIQRALVKAIALHGLGLYIYAGEDLPEGAEESKPSTNLQPKLIGEIKSAWLTLKQPANAIDAQTQKLFGCKLTGLTEEQANDFLSRLKEKVGQPA